MSEFPPLDELVQALMEDSNPAVRAEAARLIGAMAHTLSGDDLSFAKQAIDRAMTDPDPSVLMSAMSAMSRFPSSIEDDDEDDYIDEDDQATMPIMAESCKLCGKPLALVEPATCTFDNCPYR